MPFISEYIWQNLNGTSLEGGESIMVKKYPESSEIDSEVERLFETIKDATVSIRRAKATIELANKSIEKSYIKIDDYRIDRDKLVEFVPKLSKVSAIEIVESAPKGCISDIGQFCEVFIPAESIDLSPIFGRLNCQREKTLKEIEKVDGMLNNKNFVSNAPEHVLKTNRDGLKSAKERLEKIESEINRLKSISDGL